MVIKRSLPIDPSGSFRGGGVGWGGPTWIGAPASVSGPTITDRTPARAPIRVPVGRAEPGGGSIVPTRVNLPRVAIPTSPARERGGPSRIPQPPARPIPIPVQTKPVHHTLPTKQETPDMPIDLGNLLGKAIDVWGSVERAGARGPTVAPTLAQWNPPLVTASGVPRIQNVSHAVDQSTMGLDVPGVEIISEEKLDQGLVYKKVCGAYRWVHQKRRRRKKLLTDADFNALLRIQALKVNSNMTIAIAKALGR